MARVSIPQPAEFIFTTEIPVRITDVNYGGHVGNDSILSIIHEARMQFLRAFNYSEKDLGGVGMIMGDVSIVFKNELFYGETIIAKVAVTEISRATFDLIYLFEKMIDDKTMTVVQAKTGMVCFDYEKRKPAALPEQVRLAFENATKLS